MLIYLDVCCLNRPFDDQSQERIRLECEAVLLILERCQRQEWRALGSEAVDYEISRIPDGERCRKVYYLASIVESKQSISESVEDRAGELEQMSFRAVDALHIACAEAGNADVLLTTDDQLVNQARQHSGVLRVRVENPIVWLMEVTTNGATKNVSRTD